MNARRAGWLGLLWVAAVLIASALGARPLHLLGGWLLTTGPALGAAVVVVGSAVLWGRLLVGRVAPGVAVDDRLARGVIEGALGLAVLQTAAVLLGLAGLLIAPVAAILLLTPLVASRWTTPEPSPEGVAPPARAAAVWWVLAGALLLPALLEVGAPMLAPDEGQYHRRFVEHLLATGGFHLDLQDGPSAFAQGMHALGALAAHLGGLGALRPLAMLLGLGGLLAAERVAGRLFGPTAAGWTLVIGAGAASLLRVLPTFNTDLVLAPLVGAAVLVTLDLVERPEASPRRALSLALIGGAALSIKYTAPLFIGPLVLVAAVAAARAGQRRLLLWLAAAALLPALFAVPWMWRAAATFGHPLFPFFGFEPPDEHVAGWSFNFTRNYGPGGAGAALVRSPWDLFVLGREFDRRLFLGRLNPWPLAALPGLLLACRARRGPRVLAVALALIFVGWSLGLRRTVYLLPAWPLIAAAAGGGLATLVEQLGPSGRTAATGLLAAALVITSAAEVAAPWQEQLEAGPVACGTEDPEAWAEERLPEARVLRWLREHGAEDEAIAMLWGWHAWDLPGRVLWLGAEEHTPLRAKLVSLGSAPAVAAELRRLDVRWIVHRRVYFLPAAYPMVPPEAFEATFARPLAIGDELLDCCATRRFSHGSVSVWEFTTAAE